MKFDFIGCHTLEDVLHSSLPSGEMKETVHPHPAQTFFFPLERPQTHTHIQSFQMLGNNLLPKIPDRVVQSYQEG